MFYNLVNDIIDGLIKSLRAQFNESQYTIYTEHVKQEIKKPCFFILNLQSEQQKNLKGRYKEIHSFTIQYMPQNLLKPNVECHDVISKLFEVLEFIELKDGAISTNNIKYKIVEGVLHCFITYEVHMKTINLHQAMMETKQVKGRVKNE